MSCTIETSLGPIHVKLFIEECPNICYNFIRLCSMKFYDFSKFHEIEQDYYAVTGLHSSAKNFNAPGPTAEALDKNNVELSNVTLIEQLSNEGPFLPDEIHLERSYAKQGLLMTANSEPNMNGSKFLITLSNNRNYTGLKNKHTIFAQVVFGLEVLDKLNNVEVNEQYCPINDIPYIKQCVLKNCNTHNAISNNLIYGLARAEARTRTKALVKLKDIESANIKPDECCLFVCKLNSVTNSDDLRIIFSRFGTVKECTIIRDWKTKHSLKYAFIRFSNKKEAEFAYKSMKNAVIDNKKVVVTFCQSAAVTLRWLFSPSKIVVNVPELHIELEPEIKHALNNSSSTLLNYELPEKEIKYAQSLQIDGQQLLNIGFKSLDTLLPGNGEYDLLAKKFIKFLYYTIIVAKTPSTFEEAFEKAVKDAIDTLIDMVSFISEKIVDLTIPTLTCLCTVQSAEYLALLLTKCVFSEDKLKEYIQAIVNSTRQYIGKFRSNETDEFINVNISYLALCIRLSLMCDNTKVANILLSQIDHKMSLPLCTWKSAACNFYYYSGCGLLLQGNYLSAYEAFERADQYCPTPCIRLRNLIFSRMLILKLLQNEYCGAKTLREHNAEHYSGIVQALINGDVALFHKTLIHYEHVFVKDGTTDYLFLLKDKVYVRLFNHVVNYLKENQHNSNIVPVKYFRAALSTAGTRYNDSETILLLSDLISKSAIKGYVSYDAQKLVLSKDNPFVC